MTADGGLLVVCAQKEEAQTLLDRHAVSGPRRDGSVSTWRIEIGGVPLRLAVTGEGRRLARAGMEQLCASAPESVLVIGVAGALTPDLAVGDVLAALAVREPDGSRLELVARREAASASIVTGEIVTIDEIVSDPQRRAALAASSAEGVPVAVDMESYDYARVAADHAVPLQIVRVISDAAHEPLPTFLTQHRRADGSLNRLKIAQAAALRPTSWPHLLRLRRRVKAASQTLATHVETLIPLSE